VGVVGAVDEDVVPEPGAIQAAVGVEALVLDDDWDVVDAVGAGSGRARASGSSSRNSPATPR
jgi:hypothetical protein